MKVIINKCHGGFRLSTAAYRRLIELGIPVRKYTKERRGPDGRYIDEPANEGRIIFDRELTGPEEDELSAVYWKYRDKSTMIDRYWDTWIRDARTDPLIIRVVQELGETASAPVSKLKIVEIPDEVEWEIQEYDGMEWIAEKHRTWG